MSVAYIENKKLVLEQIHNFKNEISRNDNCYSWDIDMLFNELIIGLKKAKKMGIEKCYIGIDTWAVDYAMIDNEGNLLDKVFSYRDKRTKDIFKKLPKEFDLDKIYSRTGIVSHEFNTIYQLYAHKVWEIEKLNKILLLPDYLIFKLTGEKIADVTNLATTQLFDIDKKIFIEENLKLIKIDQSKFGKIVEPGTLVGPILNELIEKYDLPICEVISVASHDTSSAIAAIPTQKEGQAFISSGTWSLLGVEKNTRVITKDTLKNKFTNQLGVNHKITFLKNIIGMWILQEIEKNLSNKFSTPELIIEALKYDNYNFIMDCENKNYLMPDNMIYEIWKYFETTGQKIPFDLGALIRCVIDSLALAYNDNLTLMENILNEKIESVYIFGGGCQNKLLNQTFANISKKIIYSGPVDATIIGNAIVQLVATNEIKDLNEGRKIIIESFVIDTFYPDENDYTTIVKKYNLIKEMRKSNWKI